ncbi:hypothetical protein AB0G74_32415 [Streptomyces sp. NPDC020875]|uniref:hypothetical protein n=1 Tax=Streptomyces sp. NPDC020875 TaxID=3154898 RepID=UPI0033DF2DF2
MPSADEIVQKMRALQERREAAVGPLVDVLTKRIDLLRQLAELDEPYGQAYVGAEAAGWTPGELAELGADEPVKRPRVRQKRARSTPKSPASGAAPEGGSPPEGIPAQGGAPSTDGAAPGAVSG